MMSSIAKLGVDAPAMTNKYYGKADQYYQHSSFS